MKRSFVWSTILTSAALAVGVTHLDSVLPDKTPGPLGQRVLTSGQGGYHTYRIPALAVAGKGTILAFCEGRANSAGDQIACLYEVGSAGAYEGTWFVNFPLNSLVGK